MVKTKDLRAMSLDELESKLVECKKEQFNLRIQQSTGQLQNTAQLAKVRKEVAKINTLITERKKNNSGRNIMPKRILQGVVVSDKQDKTVVVSVERQVMHPVYKKFIKKSKKYAAHDENNQFKVGDTVRIQECAPVSKNKTWTVIVDNA